MIDHTKALEHYQQVLRDAQRDAAIRERAKGFNWLQGEPVDYWCGKCRETFEACDAITDINEEGAMLLCPFCGSEELTDPHEHKDSYHDWNTG
jgi:Zn finger protein HypA/HybF involved in hydrogenase expression